MLRPLTRPLLGLLALLALPAGCTVIYHRVDDSSELAQATVRPGITVLLRDSVHLIRGKRIALLTNQTGVDEKKRRDVDLLRSDKRARDANTQLVLLFSPEHGFAGTADRENLPSTTDAASGLPIVSLYGPHGTEGPPDSLVATVDAILVDLPDVGSRTWTYGGVMVYTMRAAARAKKPIIILDRPNPITGSFVEGPVLDSALANPNDPAPGHAGLAWALYPIPLRHGMTMGELARFYNGELKIGADLHVVPAAGWSREVWFDRTNLPFVAPSPNLQSLHAELLYTALVPFEASNLSVGRGTTTGFQVLGAPWLDPKAVIAALHDRGVKGVRFTPHEFTPRSPGDNKYGGQAIPGILFEVTERDQLQTARLCAALLSTLHKLYPTQMTLDTLRFDRLFGSTAVRQQILRGDDPDAVIDRTYGPTYAFRQRAMKYLLY